MNTSSESRIIDAASTGFVGPQPLGSGLVIFRAWAYDPAVNNSGTALAAGTWYATLLPIVEPTTISSLHVYVSSSGSGITGSAAGLYDTSGSLLSRATLAATALQSGGLKTLDLDEPVTVSGHVYVAWATAGTTAPSLARGGSYAMINYGLATPYPRFGTAATAYTGGDAPASLAGFTASTPAYWAAVS